MNQSASLSIGLDAVIESIPVKFSLGSGSASSRMENFCKTFDETYKSNSQRYSEANLVSPEAVKAWSDCVKLYGEGIKFNPLISTTQVTVVVEKNRPTLSMFKAFNSTNHYSNAQCLMMTPQQVSVPKLPPDYPFISAGRLTSAMVERGFGMVAAAARANRSIFSARSKRRLKRHS